MRKFILLFFLVFCRRRNFHWIWGCSHVTREYKFVAVFFSFPHHIWIEYHFSLLSIWYHYEQRFFFHRQQYGCFVSTINRANEKTENIINAWIWKGLMFGMILYNLINIRNDTIFMFFFIISYYYISDQLFIFKLNLKSGYLDGGTIKNESRSDITNVLLFLFSIAPKEIFH